jgi:hypothetical protein
VKKSDLVTMLQNVIECDDELRDVLVMLAQTVEAQAAQIKRLEKEMKRVNEMYPSTAIKA